MEMKWTHVGGKKDPKMHRFHSKMRNERMKLCRKKGTHKKEQWLNLVRLCKNKCVCCGKKKNLTKDHIIAVYQGGSDSIENIQPLCKSCNSSTSGKQVDYRPAKWKSLLSI